MDGTSTMIEHVGIVTGLADFANFLAAVTAAGKRDHGDGDSIKAVLFGLPVSLPTGLQKEFMSVIEAGFPEVEPYIFPPELVSNDRIDFNDAATARLQKTSKKRIVYGNALPKSFHQLLYAHLKADEFIFFDNGLSSYWDQQFDTAVKFPKLGIPVPSIACLSLSPPLNAPDYLNGIPIKELSFSDYDDAYANFRKAAAMSGNGWLPEHVILGTSIYRTGHLSWNEERSVYLRLIEAVKKRGGEDILFKSHPRATERPLIFESDGVSVMESSLPIEAFAKPDSKGTAYGIASTSLISFERYFGWKSFRIDATETRRAVKKKPHRGLAAAIEPIIID